MSRYINIEEIQPRQYENSEVDLGVLAYDYDEVDAMPFIDIVTCKECKHGTYYEDAEMYICNAIDQVAFDANHFCSYGERIEQ